MEELKKDESKALELFTKGEGGFRDRDLFPFCGGPEGNFTAHPTLVGQSMREATDSAGVTFGAEIYRVAEEGKIVEVVYHATRPDGTGAAEKVAFVSRVNDQYCAVSYYK